MGNKFPNGMLTKHFSIKEMDCKCKRSDCDAIFGIPISPTSARRCVFWNGMVDGSRRSQHIYGNACDFWFQDQIEKERFIRIAENVGFLGIGTGTHLVHIDNRKKYTRWSYEGK